MAKFYGFVCALIISSGVAFHVPLTAAEMDLRESSFTNIAKEIQESIVSIVRERTETISKNDECALKVTTKEIGSGIIVSPEGYILTSKGNVAGNPGKIKVILLPEKKQIDAKLVDITGETAILKINSPVPLSPAKLGDSDGVRLREEVLAIWSREDSLTLTFGVISAMRDRVPLPSGVINTNAFQIDANFFPEGIGGALVNMKGEVIGILYSRITDRDGNNMGVNFAIPVNSAKGTVDIIIKHGGIVKENEPLKQEGH